ncbi:MAG: glycosyltransferase family 25 protein [Bacteroidetes bacterium]|nr:glycosyltransferase family 25 protein [Bacteroidota bacterium]
MKIYIVNLKRSTDRKDAIINEVAKLNNSFEFYLFNAIDAKENEHIPFKEKHFSNLAKYFRGKDLTDGEFACFASHYCLWQECIKLDEPIIILEDDITIQPHFEDGIKNIMESNYNFVKLVSTFINNENKIKHNSYLSEHFILSKKVVCGTQGYYLTPFAANNFIKHSRKWYKPVDDYMESFWINNIPTITYHPPLIADNPNYNTTIERKKNKIPFRYKITRELSNFFRNIIRNIYCSFTLNISKK